MEKCQHEYSRGISCMRGEFFSFCVKCGKKWYDKGKRWEEQKNKRKNN